MLEFITCVKDDHEADKKYFTVGKSYPIVDYWDCGVIVSDDDNASHYLSRDYMRKFFELNEQEV